MIDALKEASRRLDKQSLLRLYKKLNETGLFGREFHVYEKLLDNHMKKFEEELKKEQGEMEK